ncbi:hypothetical protein HGM15179_000467, partial [Zosterops borbonicus]
KSISPLDEIVKGVQMQLDKVHDLGLLLSTVEVSLSICFKRLEALKPAAAMCLLVNARKRWREENSAPPFQKEEREMYNKY